jgi:ATP-binding protein involved in chromosome partitioning
MALGQPNTTTQAVSETDDSVSKDAVMAALDKVNDPELHQSLVKLGMVENVAICSGVVSFSLVLTTTACPLKDSIKTSAADAVRAVPGVKDVNVSISGKTLAARMPQKAQIAGIKNIIAVSSGKGGVGKTTVSVNLACALKQLGASVGILDADIYGPNVPKMMGLQGELIKGQAPSGKAIPLENHGVKVMSMALLMKDDEPVVWRGPILDKVIRQFFTDFEWDELDYLIVDLPPGTGDAQLTIIQATPVMGAIIVTTPQEVAILDSRKGLAMFSNANVPILGIVENMSYFVGDDGKRYEIFGNGGGRKAAEELRVPFLGELPMLPLLREKADQGMPMVVADPQAPQSEILMDIAGKVIAQVCELGVKSNQNN